MNPSAIGGRLRAASLLAALLPATLLLPACGDRRAASGRDPGAAAESLPAPVANGAVTGAPDRAAGERTPSLGEGPAPLPTPEELGIATPPVNPETGLGVDPDGTGPLAAPPAQDAGAAEPTAADAVALVRDYYAAINARDYVRAYSLWSEDGHASGQTPQQFADGFAQTQAVSVDIGAPGREDAGAGQRYIEVPVALQATQADGGVRRFAGSYVLHRAVVDGASADQRSWRIRSADLREVAQ